MKLKKIFIFAGEPSGDLHGANLVIALKKVMPTIEIAGVAGKRMRAVGVSGPLSTENFEVMGLTDVLLAFPRLYKQFYQILDFLLKNPPDVVILIDYPGFNLRLAKHLRQRGYQGKIIQYISPSVWAWGKHRIEQMEKTLDLLLTIYPFEASHFKDSKLKVKYVGSPVKEKIIDHQYNSNWKETLHIPPEKPLISIFPGSRKSEITKNLTLILEAIKKFELSHPEAIFGLSCSINTSIETLKAILRKHNELKNKIFIIPHEFTYDLMKDSHLAIAKSGTVTLELALHKTPTIVVYKLTKLNRFYAKYILKTKLEKYCIVNILAGSEVFPELIKDEFKAEKLYRLLGPMYDETSIRKNCIEACDKLYHSLGNELPSFLAAETISKELS